MLRFEAALARAEASLGLIPVEAAEGIARACDPAAYDLTQLGSRAAAAGNVAIPLVAALTERVARDDERAAEWVHYGATSQDAIDTGFVLQLREALSAWRDDLNALQTSLQTIAARESRTPMVARTWLQHAVPTTFGRKAAGWLSAIDRCRRALAVAESEACVLQFGGAAGTLAGLGEHGAAVAEALGAELALAVPPASWHSERDRLTALAGALGVVVGVTGKIARDVSLLAQSEVAEAAEPSEAARGSSSTMPQKRNPIACSVALAAALRVPGLVATMFAGLPQEHERGLAGWQAEWETLPEILRVGGGALRAMRHTIAGLQLDRARMGRQLSSDDAIYAEAMTFALAERLGRIKAHRLVANALAQAQATGTRLRDVLAADAVVREALGPAQLDALFSPEAYVNAAEAVVHRVLAHCFPAHGREPA
jgi:3-carboxy-cis,cis-muconate cycloisomerase